MTCLRLILAALVRVQEALADGDADGAFATAHEAELELAAIISLADAQAETA